MVRLVSLAGWRKPGSTQAKLFTLHLVLTIRCAMSACNSGLEFNGVGCADIDECEDTSPVEVTHACWDVATGSERVGLRSGGGFTAACRAEQSSTSSGGVASNALDGDTDGYFNSGTCTHTNPFSNLDREWWMVDLHDHLPAGALPNERRTASQVRIWNRQDCCRGRLAGFKIFVTDSPSDPDSELTNADNLCYTHSGLVETNDETPLVVPCGKKGRYVWIVLDTGNNNILTLCEVEIYCHDCAPNPRKCDANEVCKNTVGSFECACDTFAGFSDEASVSGPGGTIGPNYGTWTYSAISLAHPFEAITSVTIFNIQHSYIGDLSIFLRDDTNDILYTVMQGLSPWCGDDVSYGDTWKFVESGGTDIRDCPTTGNGIYNQLFPDPEYFEEELPVGREIPLGQIPVSSVNWSLAVFDGADYDEGRFLGWALTGRTAAAECECKLGFAERTSEFSDSVVWCANVDECATGVANCAPEAICIDTEGSFACYCRDGYYGDGLLCDNVNECASSPGTCQGGLCADTEGSFTCPVVKCAPAPDNAPTVSSDQFFYVSEAIDGVIRDPGYPEYAKWPSAWYKPLDTCDDVAYLTIEFPKPLIIYGVTVWSYWRDFAPLRFCSQSVDVSLDGTFSHHIVMSRVFECSTYEDCGRTQAEGRTVRLSGPQVVRFIRVGTSRSDITNGAEIIEVKPVTHPCNVEASCTDTPDSFACSCNAGYGGDGLACANVNECSLGTDNCHFASAKCADTVGSFTCKCNAGYSGDGVGCLNENECALGKDTCNSPGAETCVDLEGSFYCQCHVGYQGPHCTADINECQENSGVCSGENVDCVNTHGSFLCEENCVSGEVVLNSFREGNAHEQQPIRVRDLSPGDKVEGLGSDQQLSWCTVEAVGLFAENGTLFGNYTKDHMVLALDGSVKAHGQAGGRSTGQLFNVITDCPAVLDETGVAFTSVDRFCGTGSAGMSWSDYVLLHGAMLKVVRNSGSYWFSGATYNKAGNKVNATEASSFSESMHALCFTMLSCVKDKNECDAFESAAAFFVEEFVVSDAQTKTRQSFPSLGNSGGVPGSVSHTVANHFRTPAAISLYVAGGLFVLAVAVAVVSSKYRRQPATTKQADEQADAAEADPAVDFHL